MSSRSPSALRAQAPSRLTVKRSWATITIALVALGSSACTTVVPPLRMQQQSGSAFISDAPAVDRSSAGVDADGQTLGSLLPISWEGGPNYWLRFPKARDRGWADPAHFPIGVFMGKPEHAGPLAAIGVNLYVSVEHDGSSMDTVTSHGLSVIAQDEWTPAEVGSDPGVVGWFISDECDIGLGCTGTDERQLLAEQKRLAAKFRAHRDGRFLAANYANGILRTHWSKSVMPQMLAVVDVASNDKYAYTSPHVRELILDSPDWAAGVPPGRAAAYGWQIEQMRRLQQPVGSHPNWIVVETAMPLLTDPGRRTITVDEMEGAVWSALIHEARGIIYFQHNNGDTCGTYSLVECDRERLEAVRALNASIRALAPVLNTQSLSWSFNSTTDTMLKVHGESIYIFAALGPSHHPGRKVFRLPEGVGGATAEVVGEGRSLRITAGQFADDFASEHSHHVYRIPLLSPPR